MASNNQGRGRGWGGNRGRGGGAMPAAPGVQLDNEAMCSTLGSRGDAPQRGAAPSTQVGSGSSYASVVGQSRPRPAPPSAGVQAVRQPYDVYVVLDFEATCEENKRLSNHEVIEFPLVLVDPDRLCIAAEFQRYVRPVQNPRLSSFCTELTGIDQATVDQANDFPEVFEEVKHFLSETAGLGEAPPRRSYCVVTCGDWDLKTMLPMQLRVSGGRLDVPAGLQRWCNLKTFMKNAQPPFLHRGRPARLGGMPDMLEAVGLTLEGRHHSGIDDCRNIARVLLELMKRGYVVGPTCTLDVPLSQLHPWRAEDSAGGDVDNPLPPLSDIQSDLSPFSPAAAVEGGPTAAAQEPAVKHTCKEGAPTISQGGGAREKRPGGGPKVGPGAAQRLPAVIADEARDPAADLLANSPNVRALSAGEAKSISKTLSFLLRHGADKAGIPISVNGFCRLNDVLNHGPLLSRKVTAGDIAQVVSSNDKQRYRMVYEQGSGLVFIAACQGHSLDGIEVAMKTIERPEDAADVVIHGTYWDAFRKIRQCGYLSVMSRHHIHFAKGFPGQSGVISGMRASAHVVLYLDVAKCLADGVPLQESANGVILTPGVGDTGKLPLKYISKAVDRESGQTLSLE